MEGSAVIDEATGLEVRSYGPVVKDPDLTVLIDELLERGAKLDVWTDEEAERCRLTAFFPETALWAQDDADTFGRPSAFPQRRWSHGGWDIAVERPFSAYDLDPDVTLLRPIEEWPNAEWRFAPRWCFDDFGQVLPWPRLVVAARDQLAIRRAEAAARTKRKNRRAARAATTASP